MKRHESLAPLSRDHHGGLMLAQLIKKDAPVYKGLPETAEEKNIYAVNYYHSHLKEHFKQEETMLQLVELQQEAFTALAAAIVAEHSRLTEMFTALPTAPDVVKALDETGRLLEQHIRKEERVLFPLLQQQCSAETLNNIAALFNQRPDKF